MQAISGVMQSILLQLIVISMHIDMHIPQSFIHRHIVFISIFIMSIGISFFEWNSARGPVDIVGVSILIDGGVKSNIFPYLF